MFRPRSSPERNSVPAWSRLSAKSASPSSTQRPSISPRHVRILKALPWVSAQESGHWAAAFNSVPVSFGPVPPQLEPFKMGHPGVLCPVHRDSGPQVEHSCVSPGSLVLEENLVRAVVVVQSWSQSHIPFSPHPSSYIQLVLGAPAQQKWSQP